MNPYESREVLDALEAGPRNPERRLSLLETFAISLVKLFFVLFTLGVFAFKTWSLVFFFSTLGAVVFSMWILCLELLRRALVWLQKCLSRSTDQAVSSSCD